MSSNTYHSNYAYTKDGDVQSGTITLEQYKAQEKDRPQKHVVRLAREVTHRSERDLTTSVDLDALVRHE